jgi:Spy/CpxP family protein refolding chaperone
MVQRFKRIGSAVGAAVLVLGLAGTWVSAQSTNSGSGTVGGGPGRGRGPGGPGGPMGFLGPLRMAASQLGLSETQKDQIKAIAASHADEWKALVGREQQARQALQTSIAATPFDELTIRQRSAELAVVDADAAVARGRARAEVFQLLTAAQQATLATIEAKMSQGRGRRG